MNPPTTGYYSLIQYCPDRGRLEVANIGVLLFCPERQYLRARLSTSNERVRHFFGEEGGDLKQIATMKKMLQRRLESEAAGIKDLSGLRRFCSLLANEIVISDPRPALVEEPDVDLAQIYDDLVARVQRREPAPEATLLNRLEQRWATDRLKAVVQRNVTVKVPVFGNELTVPFAYQNGKLNLIEPHEFNYVREQDLIRDVSTKALQGRLIYKHADPEQGKRQLVIVAAYSAASAPYRHQVEEALRDHDVQYYEESTVSQLEQEMIAMGH